MMTNFPRKKYFNNVKDGSISVLQGLKSEMHAFLFYASIIFAVDLFQQIYPRSGSRAELSILFTDRCVYFHEIG